ncbi:hypothetical protein AGMMS49975_17420 [Clostridia bacterium]|nr:hypothetical protein AGMMS49975_17420 [Clostridia bacterium]
MAKNVILFFGGLILFLVVTVLFFENLNAINTGNSLNQILRISVEKACEYYGQETYKTDGTGLVGNKPNVSGEGGGFVSGEFYEGASPEAVFASLYTSSGEFQSFVNTYDGYWENLSRYKNSGVNGNELFGENLITPLNQGITYLDRAAIERIARWNFASNLANGEGGTAANLYISGAGEPYIDYAGFYVYPESFHISNFAYTVCDLGTSAGQDTFLDMTYVEPSRLFANAGAGEMERTKVMVVDVDFTVDISYHGITQAYQQVTRFSQTNRVSGIGTGDVPNPYDTGDNFDVKASYTNKGFGARGVTGKLIYYVIR